MYMYMYIVHSSFIFLFQCELLMFNNTFSQYFSCFTVCKEPPYRVEESGYAGFLMPIEVYFKNKVSTSHIYSNICTSFVFFMNNRSAVLRSSSVFLDVWSCVILPVLGKCSDEEFCNSVKVKVTQLDELNICTGS